MVPIVSRTGRMVFMVFLAPFLFVSCYLSIPARIVGGQPEPLPESPGLLSTLADKAWSSVESAVSSLVGGAYHKASEYVTANALDIVVRTSFSWVLTALLMLGKQKIQEKGGAASGALAEENSTLSKIAEIANDPFIKQYALRVVGDLLKKRDLTAMTFEQATEYAISTALDVIIDILAVAGIEGVVPRIDFKWLDLLKEYLEWKLLNPSGWAEGVYQAIAKSAGMALMRKFTLVPTLVPSLMASLKESLGAQAEHEYEEVVHHLSSGARAAA